jgi:O-Antigen ligase
MESSSMRSLQGAGDRLRGADWPGIATWLLGFAVVAYLGAEGGGYDPIVHDQVAIAAWWLLLAGVAVGALPRSRPTPLAWGALGLLAAFTAWTALSLGWTESGEDTFSDLARVTGYLGFFAVALLLQGRGGARHLLGGVAAGIVLVAGIGLLSRLHPAWFPEADETARFLEENRERLSYPLHYWNAVGALLAIGYPLVLHFASTARSLAARALAAGALPAMMLASFFTFSRAGIGAAALAIGVYLLLASDRLPKVLTILAAGAGGAILCVAANSRDELADGIVNATSETQGDEMLLMTLFVCVVAAALGLAIAAAMREGVRPPWSYVDRGRSLVGAGVAVAVALVVLVAIDAPGRAADAWDDFKLEESPGRGSGRLFSAAGQNRYEYWQSAADQYESEPWTGTGAGTFELWWTRDRDSAEPVRDAHSLYVQTLGELGIVGLALLLAFLITVLAGGLRALARAPDAERALLSAALAGCVAFMVTSGVDWMWQIPALAACLMILAAVLASGGGVEAPRNGVAPESGFRWPLRVGAAALALTAIVVIAIPLAATGLLRDSEADAREGDLTGALEAARSAENAEPWAATPRLQQALVLEELGALDQAAEAAREATERASTNWRTWLVLARVEAQRGRAAAAVDAYRRSRSLNPESPLFDD